jgi:rhodanese-related sulfurtransferase
MTAAPEDLTPARAAELLRSGAQGVDVREQYERDAGHIADTLHIELERLAAEADTLDRERPVVFYCRGGERSAMAAEAFRNSGWDAHNIGGGLLAWAEDGLPLEPEDGEVAPRSSLPPA